MALAGVNKNGLKVGTSEAENCDEMKCDKAENAMGDIDGDSHIDYEHEGTRT